MKYRSGLEVCSWRGADDHSFSLRLDRYQFPHIKKGHDANWLVVSVSARNDEGDDWERRVPCLLTWELVWIRKWLAKVASTSNAKSEVSFLEPDLKLAFLRAEPCRYHFSVALTWGLSRTMDERPSVIHLEVSQSELWRALEQLDRAIEQFPSRGEVGKVNRQLGPWAKSGDDT